MRGVALNSAARCARCHLPLRWCICPAERTVACALAVDVVMHHRERYRPSSTGHLITRVMPAARCHPWRREQPVRAEQIRQPGRELWVLHPQGGPPPAEFRADQVQVVLLDGSWRETNVMMPAARGWGRAVNLPMTGESRFWLRAQGDAGRFSTVEALLVLLRAFALTEAHEALRAQFELHVYAGLRARGQKALAETFLAASPARETFPDLIAALHVRRPR